MRSLGLVASPLLYHVRSSSISKFTISLLLFGLRSFLPCRERRHPKKGKIMQISPSLPASLFLLLFVAPLPKIPFTVQSTVFTDFLDSVYLVTFLLTNPPRAL